MYAKGMLGGDRRQEAGDKKEEWRNRPLQEIYTMVFIDGIQCKYQLSDERPCLEW